MQEAFLIAGTKVSFEFDPVGNPDVYTHVPGITSVGGTGETATSKDKTALEDTTKKYGRGIFDTPDKTIKGQYLSTDAALTQLRTAAKAGNSIKMKIEWPDGANGTTDGTKAVVTVQLLGFMLDEGTAEDWQMYTINGKQSGVTAWTDPL